MKFCLCFTLMLILNSYNLQGQNKESLKMIAKADSLYENDEREKALKYFDKSFLLYKKFIGGQTCYNWAIHAVEMNKNDLAFKYLKTATEKNELAVADLISFELKPIWKQKGGKLLFDYLIKYITNKFSYLNKEFKMVNKSNLDFCVPYNKNGLWGFLNRNTKMPITKPLFSKVNFSHDDKLVFDYKDTTLMFTVKNKVQEVNALTWQGNPPELDNDFIFYKDNTITKDEKINGFKEKDGSIITHNINFEYVELLPNFSYLNKKVAYVVNAQNKKGLINEDGNALTNYNFEHDLLVVLNLDSNIFLCNNKMTKKFTIVKLGSTKEIIDTINTIYVDAKMVRPYGTSGIYDYFFSEKLDTLFNPAYITNRSPSRKYYLAKLGFDNGYKMFDVKLGKILFSGNYDEIYGYSLVVDFNNIETYYFLARNKNEIFYVTEKGEQLRPKSK